eukprot:11976628-Heterocapsa_arctica.AAC.1
MQEAAESGPRGVLQPDGRGLPPHDLGGGGAIRGREVRQRGGALADGRPEPERVQHAGSVGVVVARVAHDAVHEPVDVGVRSHLVELARERVALPASGSALGVALQSRALLGARRRGAAGKLFADALANAVLDGASWPHEEDLLGLAARHRARGGTTAVVRLGLVGGGIRDDRAHSGSGAQASARQRGNDAVTAADPERLNVEVRHDTVALPHRLELLLRADVVRRVRSNRAEQVEHAAIHHGDVPWRLRRIRRAEQVHPEVLNEEQALGRILMRAEEPVRPLVLQAVRGEHSQSDVACPWGARAEDAPL